MPTDFDVAKQRLLDKLGPNYGIYIQLLGKWFRGLISKGEFDKSAKQLIEQNFVLEHNKFWLAFFHHCANSASSSIQNHNYLSNDAINNHFNQTSLNHDYGNHLSSNSPDSTTTQAPNIIPNGGTKIRCLPNKVMTHMKIFVIAWEMGLDSVNDHVSLYINLALQHLLKNIITELICTKTAYRLRENRFKYAIGVRPMNPYLNNSLKIYSSNLEYDPYQIESSKMNSSLVDTYAYNDSLFPSRLYEAQALYEFACSTTSVKPSTTRKTKRLKLSEISLTHIEGFSSESQETLSQTVRNCSDTTDLNHLEQEEINLGINCDKTITDNNEEDIDMNKVVTPQEGERRLTLFHLLLAFLSNRTIIPSQSLYSINIERIFTKLSY